MANIVNGFRDYISETRAEAKKVTWPSRSDVVASTRVILWIVFLLGIFVTVADLLMAHVFNFLRQGF